MAPPVNSHLTHVCRLRKLQGFLVDGGKRAADNDLKERRLKKKKAAEKRLKVLGEALGHVDDEDGVLVKVNTVL